MYIYICMYIYTYVHASAALVSSCLCVCCLCELRSSVLTCFRKYKLSIVENMEDADDDER